MSNPSTDPALPLLDLHVQAKHYGDVAVIADLRLALQAGEILSVVGASGCGKSTLLRIIAGLDRDHVGSLQLDGQPRQGLTRDIGFIFQEPRLFPWLNVADNIAFSSGSSARRDDALSAQVDALLHEVGLSGLGQVLPKQLSGGQAQRVAIARGLFTRPRVLLLDEPFSAVDAFTRMKLQDLLITLTERHAIGMIVVTHDIDEAVVLSDRVLVLDAQPGRLREEIQVGLPRQRDRRNPQLAEARARVFDSLRAAHAL